MDYYGNSSEIQNAMQAYRTEPDTTFDDDLSDTDSWGDEFDSEDDVLDDNTRSFPELPPELCEELYDVPDPDEIIKPSEQSPDPEPPRVLRGKKPKPLASERVPAKPAPSVKPSTQKNINNFERDVDQTCRNTAPSVSDRKAMFDQNLQFRQEKVPSPFRNNSPFSNQMITRFRPGPTARFNVNNNERQQSSNHNINDNNNNRPRQYKANPLPNHVMPDSFCEVTDNNENTEEQYEVPENGESMYIIPKDKQVIDNMGYSANHPSRELPPEPIASHGMFKRGFPQKNGMPAEEFLSRINTIKKGHHQMKTPVHNEITTEETYEVCDTESENYEVCDTPNENFRSRNNSSSSERSSTKSNASWNSNIRSPSNPSSRENSFRNDHNEPSPHNNFRKDHFSPRSPMESRPLPGMPDMEQETYEVVESEHNIHPPKSGFHMSAPDHISRPPAPIPTPGSSNKKPPPPPVKKTFVPKPYNDPDNYDYADKDLALFLPPMNDNINHGITIPDEDEYEMPPDSNDSMQGFRPPRQQNINYIDLDTNKVDDAPPIVPVRSDAPKRISPPSRPPKGEMKLPAQPSLDAIRTKPRHSYDSGMNPNARESLELSILRHGWLAGLHCQQKKDDENVERMRDKLRHNLQIPCIPPVSQEKGRSGSDSSRPVIIPKRPPVLSPKSTNGIPFIPVDVINASLKSRQPGVQPLSKPPPMEQRKSPMPPPNKPSISQRPPAQVGRPAQGNPLSSCAWYHGRLNRTSSEQILKSQNTEGGFIIRDTDKGEGYSISIYHLGNVTHLRVPLKTGRYYLGTSPLNFGDVQELVTYYQQHKIALTSGGEVLLK